MNLKLYHLLSIPNLKFDHLKWIVENNLLDDIYSPNFFEQFSLKFPKITSIKAYLHSKIIPLTIEQFLENNGKILTIFDKNFPTQLKEIYNPPLIIFARGKMEYLNEQKICAIVGSRTPSPYSKQVIEYILPNLCNNGVVTVSGLAKGVDYLVHQKTVNEKGKTIAVIAGGLNHIYPKENERFAQFLMEHQLVLSEYLPTTIPQKWQFPSRNRIISGLSSAVLVVEANKKSGSLITANLALQEGRNVLAVPGSIFNPSSEGCNDLIAAGAKLIAKPEDVLNELFEF